MVEGIQELLSAASSVTDTELAVALQGILCRRPAVREVLLGVWQAEEALLAAAPPARHPPPPSPALKAAARGADDGAGRAPAARALVGGPADPRSPPTDPVCRLRIACRRLAAFHGAKAISSEHVLAAAVATLSEASASAFGSTWHACLVELFERSRLFPPKSPGGPTGEQLSFEAETEPLFTAMANAGGVGLAHAALFAAFLALPDTAPASQLLEMAKVFAQRKDLDASLAEEPAHRRIPLEQRGRDYVIGFARRFAVHNQAKAIGTEHVLAAAVHTFPQESERLLGSAHREQLVEVFEKSSLEMPSDDVDGEVPFEPEVNDLLDAWSQQGTSPTVIIELLQARPDSDSATQLLAIAKVFADRSAI